MFIDELAPKTKVFIETTSGDKKVNLDSTIASITEPEDLAKIEEIHMVRPKLRYVIMDPIRAENKLINFVSDYANSDLIAMLEGDKLEIWKNVSIINMRLPKYGSIHVVLASPQGKIYNRRQFYRLSVGLDGNIRIRTTEKEDIYPVFIKDISESGICFMCKEAHGLERGKGCMVEFVDNEYSFRLDAFIVRTIEQENNNIAFGCKFRQRYAQVAKYVNEKQKARMAKASDQMKK